MSAPDVCEAVMPFSRIGVRSGRRGGGAADGAGAGVGREEEAVKDYLIFAGMTAVILYMDSRFPVATVLGLAGGWVALDCLCRLVTGRWP
jgi:hypothetical protein